MKPIFQILKTYRCITDHRTAKTIEMQQEINSL